MNEQELQEQKLRFRAFCDCLYLRFREKYRLKNCVFVLLRI